MSPGKDETRAYGYIIYIYIYIYIQTLLETAEALTLNTSCVVVRPPIGVRVVWKKDWALGYVATQF